MTKLVTQDVIIGGKPQTIRTEKDTTLIVDGLHGIYCPQLAMQRLSSEPYESDPTMLEARITVLDGPDAEGYWDAWDEILNHTWDHAGWSYSLEHDDDVWLIRERPVR